MCAGLHEEQELTMNQNHKKKMHHYSMFPDIYLKKWAPTTRLWDLILSPIKFKSIVEVLLANMQC